MRQFDILKLIRIKHWIKNGFVIAPVIFSLRFTDPSAIFHTLAAAFAFSFAASFVYILNDILDKKADAEHPVKRNRPIPSGRIPIPAAVITAFLFLVMYGLFSFILPIEVIGIIGFYIIMNLAYSRYLKKIAILDVMIIAMGFVLRILAGITAIAVPLSHWMLLTTFCVSLFLAFGKRRSELDSVHINHHEKSRSVLTGYTTQLLDYFIVITASVTMLAYALYTIDNDVIERLGTGSLIYTIPFVIFGIFRYMSIIFKDHSGEDPVDVVMHDIQIIITVALWIVTVVSLLIIKP